MPQVGRPQLVGVTTLSSQRGTYEPASCLHGSVINTFPARVNPPFTVGWVSFQEQRLRHVHRHDPVGRVDDLAHLQIDRRSVARCQHFRWCVERREVAREWGEDRLLSRGGHEALSRPRPRHKRAEFGGENPCRPTPPRRRQQTVRRVNRMSAAEPQRFVELVAELFSAWGRPRLRLSM
jgi:hypothetical protein